MKTEEILNLDFRDNENQEIIQKVLKQIKPLSRYSDEQIPLEAIEKLIRILSTKYQVIPKEIMMSFQDDIVIYSTGIKDTITYECLGNIYGMCIYETLSKLAIKIYSEVKSGKIPERQKSKEEIQREKLYRKIKTKE